jgi:MoaA/NifB/PqqE/SkfB family radical SAM enzyme
MECAIITTYRCNAKCDMCRIYLNPTKVAEEFNPKILEKLPDNLKRVNITGGEPTLRQDLLDIVTIMLKKAKKVDISTNGYFPERLISIGKKYPQVIFRISAEGLPKLNDDLRGLKDGFDHSLRSIIGLSKVGVRDIGLGMVISGKNKNDLLNLYSLCVMMGINFSTSTLHNSFYFNKTDNIIDNVGDTAKVVQEYIVELLKSRRRNIKMKLKDWAKAYVNYGILNHIKGEKRPIPCGAGTELFFLDPYGRILACNGSPEPWIMGNLNDQTFDEIWNSEEAQLVRNKVKNCTRECWMVGSARPAMRSHFISAGYWIFSKKIKLLLGQEIWQN